MAHDKDDDRKRTGLLAAIMLATKKRKADADKGGQPPKKKG